MDESEAKAREEFLTARRGEHVIEENQNHTKLGVGQSLRMTLGYRACPLVTVENLSFLSSPLSRFFSPLLVELLSTFPMNETVKTRKKEILSSPLFSSQNETNERVRRGIRYSFFTST